MLEPVQQRIKKTLYLLLAGGRNRGHGAAMEGIGGGDDFVALRSIGVAAVLAGQLDGRLVGLGAAVAEEGLIGKGVVAEQLRQFDLLRDLIIIGTMNQLCGLLLQSRNDLGMTVPQIVDRHTPEKIKVLFAIGIPQAAPFSPDRHDRVAAIGPHDVSVRFFNPLL